MPQTYGLDVKPAIRTVVRLLGFLQRVDGWLDERMPPVFCHRVRLEKDSPRHHRHETIEYEWPFRRAEASHVIRFFGHFGIVAGRWDAVLEEEDAQVRAVEARAHDRIEPNSYGERLTVSEWTFYPLEDAQ